MAQEVVLHLYDLTHGMARSLSLSLLGRHIDAVWHTGVVAFGVEHYFGGGTQTSAPGCTHFGRPTRTLVLGHTHVTAEVFRDFLVGIAPRFTADTYNILTHNCNNYSDQISHFLLGHGIPQAVLDLPRTVMESQLGPLLAPMLQPLSSALQVTEPTSPHAAPASDAARPAAAGAAVHAALAPAAPASDASRPAAAGAAVDAAFAPDDGEAAFQASCRAEFEALTAAGVDADKAAEQAVSRVLERAGLA